MRGLFDDGGNWVAAGLAAAVLLPLLAIGLGLPIIIAAPVALIACVGMAMLLSPRKLFEGIDVSTVGRGRIELARKVLAEALPYRDRLKAAALNHGDKEIGAKLRHMAETTDHIIGEVEESPEKLTLVTRFLSYYLPKAVEVAEGFAMIQQKRVPDTKRLGETREMIGKLESAFGRFSDGLVDADLKGLDVELKLLEASLKDDVGNPT
jgi:5-bromo-4-chloroindolyl phosphate hydrolysis protein